MLQLGPSLLSCGQVSAERRRDVKAGRDQPTEQIRHCAGVAGVMAVAVAALALDHRHDGGADRDHREGQIDRHGRVLGELREEDPEQCRQTRRGAWLVQPVEQAPAAPRQSISTHERNPGT